MASASLWSLALIIVVMFENGQATHIGNYFLTAFLQNGNSSFGNAVLDITITAFDNPATVTVHLNEPHNTWSLFLDSRESRTVQVSYMAEMIGSAIFNSSIYVMSDEPVSVMCLNSKAFSSSRIVVYPAENLGTQYFIVMPDEGSDRTLKEFAVVNHNVTTNVQISLNGWAIFAGQNYSTGQPLKVILQPLEVLQLQSENDLSGSMVLAEYPVAVLTGLTCAWNNNSCDHVYEQLLPVSGWGKEYIIHPLPFQYKSDVVYVSASQDTEVNYASGPSQQSVTMHEGQVLKLPIRTPFSLVISSNVSVQILFYCTGGFSQNIQFDPFFVSIPDTSKYCTEYQVHGLQGFINAVLITAKTDSISGIKFNKQILSNIQWKKIQGTKYSWAQYRFGRQYKSHIISHSGSPFSALSIGLSSQASYGLLGVCVKQINSCDNIECRKKESCYLFKGQPACVPDSEAMCRVSGDPHYHTFDGFTYDFQGTCSYTVAKTCMGPNGTAGDPTLPEFNIEARNKNRGHLQVSYIAAVYVQFYGYNITMLRSEIGFVRVNNIRWSLPLSLDKDTIHITTSGFHALLETDFIRIRYDWNVFLIITIPSSFFENVCGLCGYYNDDPKDDFLMLSGAQASGPVEFGKSWKVNNADDGECWNDCHGPCDSIRPEDGNVYEDPMLCGILSRSGGPFDVCNKVIDPSPFIKNCIYDMVKNDGYKRVLCQAVSVYMVVCQMNGILVEEWRNVIDCEILCPGNSQYNVCGNTCPATCFGKPTGCLSPCMETCECNPGFVLAEGKCIPSKSCGCLWRGHYFPLNDAVWGRGDCTQKCSCNPETQKVVCSDSTCRAGEQCSVKEGMKDCYPDAYGTCTTYGDSHYITFDGFRYDFLGTCKYLLSGLCIQSQGLTDFQVHVLNRNQLSHTRSVWVRVYGVEVLLTREHPGKAMLNGIFVNLPFNFELDQIQVFTQGWHAVILTKFGLKITFDYQSRITITIPQSYSHAVCGLCGNFNGDPGDDLTVETGQKASSILTFGYGWRTNETVLACGEEDPKPCANLLAMEEYQRQTYGGCGILLRKDGPFKECHHVLDPEGYFQNCLYDYCFYKGRQDVFCRVITAYASACQEVNGIVHQWRNESFCKTWCPENSHYEVCSLRCQETCSHISTSSGCSTTCSEGCVCDNGYIHNVDRCVPVSKCGCLFNGFYYKTGKIFYPTINCDQQCVCKPGGAVHCTSFSCSPKEECRILNGVRRCHPTETAVCSASGDPHYKTFDGLRYNFQGGCCYTLTKSCSKDNSNGANFSVVMENEKLADRPVSIIRRIKVRVNDAEFSIEQGKIGKIQVNGLHVNLPLHLLDKEVWVYQHGFKVVLLAACGIQVSYDLAFQVLVKISNSFQSQVCGLCGNYNGNATDDWLLPGGSLAGNVTTFGEAWLDETCSGACARSLKPGDTNTTLGTKNDQNQHVGPEPFSLWIQNIQKAQKCSNNSHYTACADSCWKSCASFISTNACPLECSKGCECDEGYYLDVDSCVSLDKCGCGHRGRYYKIGETFLKDHCRQLCTCNPNGVVTCSDYMCENKKLCKTTSDGSFMCKKD